MRRFFYWLFRKKKRYYGFKIKTYKYPAFHIGHDPFSKDDLMSGFGMIIPTASVKINEMVEDPRGAPIYAPCPAKGGLCACTGACRRIVDYSKDPVKLSAYREYINNYNSFQKSQMQNFNPAYKWETKRD